MSAMAVIARKGRKVVAGSRQKDKASTTACLLTYMITAVPLKDPTSDMAVIARKGSKLVADLRQEKDKAKFRPRFWEVSGSKLGEITGVAQHAKHVCLLLGSAPLGSAS